mgnify:CR=1 FL=1
MGVNAITRIVNYFKSACVMHPFTILSISNAIVSIGFSQDCIITTLLMVSRRSVQLVLRDAHAHCQAVTVVPQIA